MESGVSNARERVQSRVLRSDQGAGRAAVQAVHQIPEAGLPMSGDVRGRGAESVAEERRRDERCSHNDAADPAQCAGQQ